MFGAESGLRQREPSASEGAEGIRQLTGMGKKEREVCQRLQINFASTKSTPYLLFLNMPHELGWFNKMFKNIY